VTVQTTYRSSATPGTSFRVRGRVLVRRRQRDGRRRHGAAEIVHPLQDAEWGVRRFFVRDPNGRVVYVLTHRGAG
jgi:hypothetical protein